MSLGAGNSRLYNNASRGPSTTTHLNLPIVEFCKQLGYQYTKRNHYDAPLDTYSTKQNAIASQLCRPNRVPRPPALIPTYLDTIITMRLSGIILIGVAGHALAHGDHSGGGGQKPIVDENANWMTKHMAEEHHLTSFDAASFFGLHDFDADGNWEPQEILRTYGLMDKSNQHVTQERKDQIVRELLDLLDADRNGLVNKDEFVHFIETREQTLPDMDTGPGHHGDDEYEYEIHHWEKYHDENTKLEDLTHPEDIEHFKKHEQMEAEQERLEEMAKHGGIIEDNIPAKFRRD